ncbi:hypothetical protein JCM11641_008042 [Rhodosporidiobolus odoratus]
MSTLSWVLNKAILVSTSFLIGSFYVHWLADHPLIWQGPSVPPPAVAASLRYYSHIYHAPPLYVTTLTSTAGVALASAGIKLILNPVSGLLFDGATLLLLISALSVYSANVLAALRYLPLDHLKPGSPALQALEKTSGGLGSALHNLGEVRLVEALQSVAASHMIIAVSLTGVLALQGAQGWADRVSPSSSDPVSTTPPSTSASAPVTKEKVLEKKSL